MERKLGFPADMFTSLMESIPAATLLTSQEVFRDVVDNQNVF